MIRVGFVGTGNITRRHFGALGHLRDQAEVVAVCDVIEERAIAAAQPFDAKVYLSFPEMLAHERLDALYVCLPPDAHVDQELVAIERGIHLFVEKPLPLDLAKA
ncbi:MAG TPA: Gfo/Idh/MocA family oxidoreductase, partial [Chloroflexota bacterium]|nr:Gfo/Idh/MocA family oxidoreductase [Chloroflexota bacterium]